MSNGDLKDNLYFKLGLQQTTTKSISSEERLSDHNLRLID
jgi:hypothetical protein